MIDITQTAANLCATLTDAELDELRDKLRPRYSVSFGKGPTGEGHYRTDVLCRDPEDALPLADRLLEGMGLPVTVHLTPRGRRVSVSTTEANVKEFLK